MSKTTERTPEQQIADLRREVDELRRTLRTLLTWLPQSDNAPLRYDEASTLMHMMDGSV